MSATEFYQKQVTEKLPSYWKLSTIRCGIYALLVGWGTYHAGINGFDHWSDLTTLQRVDLYGDIGTSMLGVWLAFLDQTLSKYNQSPPPPQQTTGMQALQQGLPPTNQNKLV